MRQALKRSLAVLALGALAGCSALTDDRDLATLERSETGNDHLLCAPGHCRAEADGPAPVFQAEPSAILDAVEAVALAEARTEGLARGETSGQWVQRSLVFRFPDTVWVEITPAEGGGSALNIYSASAYGRSDLGVNAERVERWVDAVTAVLGG